MVTITPNPVDFGTSTKVGKTKIKKVKIKNTSTAKIDVIVAGESESGDTTFSVKTQCKKTLKQKKSCEVSVKFAPTDTTPQTGDLIVEDNAENAPQTIPLMGTGK
jgi:Abnormal spindle-like microcephaly-assoc'd, ASPM-SPD-2-Hydin